MAKMLRWERAWEFFIGEFTGKGPFYRKGDGGYSRKLRAKNYAENEKFFWKLIGVLDKFGIVVLKHESGLGKADDAFGQEFTVGGTWDARRLSVNVTFEGSTLLAHEFTHAMDYIERGHYPSNRSMELVAAAGGYLLSCHYGRLYSPRFDVEYAKRQGAMVMTLEKYQEYIPQLFHQMVELID